MTSPQVSQTTLRAFIHELRAPGWPVLALTLAYLATMAAIGDLRPEHVAVAALFLLGWVASRLTRDIMSKAAPVFLIVIGFDALRYVRPLFVTADRVHSCDLRAFDLKFFGVGPDATVPDYFAAHHNSALDLFFSVPYAAFIYVAIIYSVTMYFRDRQRSGGLAWAFAMMYLIALSVWMIFPAAPPWYIRVHGCAIDLATQPGPAALARVDALLGIHYFSDFYSRGPTVFGAMPSLHNSYTVFTLIGFWPIAGKFERAAGIGYVVWMFFASLYLDHHWVVDALAGWATAAAAVYVGMLIGNRPRQKIADAAAPGR